MVDRFRIPPRPDRLRLQATRVAAAQVQTASASKKTREDVGAIDPQLDEIRGRLDDLEGESP
jgi:hypothetical protein